MELGTVQLKGPQGICGVEDARDTQKWLDTQESTKVEGSRNEHCQTQSKQGPAGELPGLRRQWRVVSQGETARSSSGGDMTGREVGLCG